MREVSASITTGDLPSIRRSTSTVSQVRLKSAGLVTVTTREKPGSITAIR